MQVPMEILLHPLHFILVFLMLIAPISATDPLSYALLSLKSEIVDESSSLKDWFLPPHQPNTSQVYACSWTGVKCNENSSKIISLDLSFKHLGGSLSGKQFNLFLDLLDLNISYNSFSGQLPPGIFNLTNLRSLDISRNNFSGHFPNGIFNLQNLVVLDAFSNSFAGPLPADVSKIDSLRVLNFAGSYFSGPIPADYGSFKSIEFIHLAGNFLGGEIPPELGKLKTLSHIEIGYNTYGGGIPWQLGNLTELQYLDIADANVSGSIPYTFSNLTKLESLFLFRNRLNGKIPWELSKILTLKSLDLSDNFLSGPIPDSFSELKNLRLLSLMYNDLNGPFPQGLSKLPQLDTLLIWNNYFTGSLPEDLGRFSRLQHVDVSTNYFVGKIPENICAGGELQKLILFSNNFTGGLSPSLLNCSSLVRLRLEDNSFSGDISLNFSNLPYLSYVDLSRNKLTGGVPSDFDQALSLEYLNVSYNQELGGILPVKAWSMPSLQNLSMVSCGVSGNIPSFEHCRSVSVIELRMNNLSGEIPQYVSNCKHLLVMDLADNNLTGSIPASFPVLGALDLSHNSLTGPIPSKFGKMEESSFLGNPKLCGPPLSRPCHPNGISNGLVLGSRRAQKLAWVLILCGGIVLSIMGLVFGILYFKRGSKGHWKMISFNGLPSFTPNDILRSFDCIETFPDSIGKVVLPTGITVSAKKIEWDAKEMKFMLQVLTRIGNVRHKNLVRLLGICYNNNLAYLLYDYMPNGSLAEKMRIRRDWESKCRIVSGIARALCFLHHDCYPAIPHGNLKGGNVLFDENMEPYLGEYGLNSIIESAGSPLQANVGKETDGFPTATMEELHMDVHNFGELILEILTNGRVTNASETTHNNTQRDLMREVVHDENGINEEEVKLAVEVALLCTRNRPSDRPSMQDVLKMLSGLKSVANGRALGIDGHKA